MSNQTIYPMVIIIKNNMQNRFKLLCTFTPVLINYFKTIEGRYYDFQLKQWSFPSIAWSDLQAFLEEKNFAYRTVNAEKYLSISKQPTGLHLKFATYQEDFKILEAIKGSKYDRSLSKYVIPLKEQSNLEGVLKENGFIYDIDSKLVFSGSEVDLLLKAQKAEEDPKKKKRRVVEEDTYNTDNEDTEECEEDQADKVYPVPPTPKKKRVYKKALISDAQIIE